MNDLLDLGVVIRVHRIRVTNQFNDSSITLTRRYALENFNILCV